MKITTEIVKKVIETVDSGLVKGVGDPVPGQMCVEAAVCYALGMPHSDEPNCVNYDLRQLKIILNDKDWPSDEARARGLRKLAVLQLGTDKNFDDNVFSVLLGKSFYNNMYNNEYFFYEGESNVSLAKSRLERYIKEYKPSNIMIYNLNTVYNVKNTEKVLTKIADIIADVLIEMNVPGVKYLELL